MKNMKYLIKLFGALALTTGAATSVVACYDPADDAVTLKAEYAKLLGLDTVKQELADNYSKVEIKLGNFDDATIKSRFEALLNADNIAKDKDATAFLKELGFTADAKGVYKDADTIKALKTVAKDTDVKIGTISKKSNSNDFVISTGTVNFTVNKADGTLIKTYKLEVAATDLAVPAKVAVLLEKDNLDLLNALSGYVTGQPTSGFKITFKTEKNEEETKYNNLLNILGVASKVTFNWSESGDNIVDDMFVASKEAKVKVLFDGVIVTSTAISLGNPVPASK